MKSKAVKIIYLFLLFSTLFVMPFDYCAYGSEVKRIALLPFRINSEKPMSYYADGIFDMFTTRLTKGDQVQVLSRDRVEKAMQVEAPAGAIDERVARNIGRRLNTDYVLFGSLTILGNNVSIDSKMVDMTGSQPTMTFFDQSQDLGAVITKINLIAADINAKMFGRTQATTPAQVTAAVAAVPPAGPQPAQKSRLYNHPEKVLQEDGFITSGQAEDIKTLGIRQDAAREIQGKFWESASFDHLINGIALGDVDGDGKIETVTIAPHAVIIFRSEGGAFRKIAEIEESNSKYLIGVDCADINENGYAEIFVTSLNADHKVTNSYILEFNGNDFSKIIDNNRHYFRVATTPNRGKILLGQRPKSGKPSAGAIYEMRWQGGDYVPVEPFSTPRDTNLIGMTIGDVLNNGRETTIAYKEGDRFQIIDSSGEAIWDNRERFGGSMLYASIPLDYRGQVENKWYFPLRLVVWYNRATKGNEVIAVQNHDLSSNTLYQLRYFTQTYIAGFTWDGVGLAPRWKTRQFSGYIQDVNLGDFDNDGQDELVAALVQKEGRVALVGEPKSALIVYELTGREKPES